MSSFPHFTALPPIHTRSDFQHALLSLLHPLTPFFSPGRARITLGATGTRFDETGAALEGFARPLWGLAAHLGGGGAYIHTPLFTTGLRNGTDPTHPEFWGTPRDVDQRMVEMCPIGFALCVAPDPFWHALGPQGQANLAAWLGAINDRAMPDTNWLWFRVFAQLGLWRNGVAIDDARLEADMGRLETFYRGQGWSNDGPEGYTQMDSYSGSFAIQFLQLLYAQIAGARDPERAARFRARARAFALDAVLYYDEVGRHVTFGRSLTYRFAMAGFWSAVAFAGVELPAPLGWGVVRGLLLRNCRWWAAQRDILSPQGTLTIGYAYPNQFMSENYNSPGSPYWFALGFAALACPAAHPFWAAREEPLPSERRLPAVKALGLPGHIMVRHPGHVFLLSSGQKCHYPVRGGAAKYGKFAYSAAFGYSVPTGGYMLEAVGGDNTIALSDDYVGDRGHGETFGETWRTRRKVEYAKIEELGGVPVLVSSWFPWKDVRVYSWLVPLAAEENEGWHLRVHRVLAGRDVRAAEGAWALRGWRKADGRELGVLEAGGEEGIVEDGKRTLAVSSAGAVGIVELGEAARTAETLQADANGNLVEQRTVLPTLLADVKAGESVWWVTAVFAMPESREGWEKAWRQAWERTPAIPSWVAEKMKNG